MKPYFTAPIKTLKEAHAFFDALYKDDLLFHPEVSPSEVIDAAYKPIFTADEARELTQRIAEVYKVDEDPCMYILDTFYTSKE